MELGQNRVWDYVGDNFVHRLVQTDGSDGKLVEAEGRCHLDNCKNDGTFEKLQQCYRLTQRARKFKNVQAKKLVKSNKSKKKFREIAFLAVLNFSPVQKLIFGHF